MSLFERIGSNLVEQSMNAQSLRQRKIAENIANINTPGYTAQRVRFENLLLERQRQSKMLHTNEKHLPVMKDVEAKVVDTGKDVVLDEETGELAKVQLFFAMESTNLSRRLKMLREAISGQIK